MAKKAKTITLEKAVPEFLDHLKSQGKNERTVAVYGRCLDNAVAFFGKDKQLAKLSPAQTGQFFKSDILLKKPNGNPKSEITVRQGKRVYRMMLTWAVEKGYIADIPLPKAELKKGGKKQNGNGDADTGPADAEQGD